MDEGQRFLRYAVPGIAAVIIFALALVLRHPRLICWLAAVDQGQTIAWVLGGLVASGGLGFLLSQIYFGLPSWFNTPDHRHGAAGRRWPRPKRCCLRPICPEENRTRLSAQRYARFSFQSRTGKDETLKVVREGVSRSAQRMASLGATITGLVILLPVWIWLAHQDLSFLQNFCSDVPRLMPALPFRKVIGLACFIIPGVLLLRARHKIREELEYMAKNVIG